MKKTGDDLTTEEIKTLKAAQKILKALSKKATKWNAKIWMEEGSADGKAELEKFEVWRLAMFRKAGVVFEGDFTFGMRALLEV